jgi:predicted ATPase
VLSGSSVDLRGGVAIPHGALTDALRLFAREVGAETVIRTFGRLWLALSPLVSDSTTTAAAESQARIFGAVLQLSDQISKRTPLVLILEDIHWADVSTLDLIRYVTRYKTNQELMLVCSYRPVAARHQLQDLLGEQDFRSRVSQVGVTPFTRLEMKSLVAMLVEGSLPDERVDRYFDLSEGNAYYAEQLIMADDPLSPDVEVPQSLREVMMARLARLSDDAADVVRFAAVAGRRVGDSVLAAASELDGLRLEHALTECVQQRVLVQDDANDGYAFQHALLRDTAYLRPGPPDVE